MSECLVVIDAGTGSGRAVVFDGGGRQLGVGQEEWTHKSEPDAPGSMSFDCDDNWSLLTRCIRKALAAAGVSSDAVRAVSSTSMREGIVLYDRSGKESWACANVDSRAEAEVRELKTRQSDLEHEFYEFEWPDLRAGCSAKTDVGQEASPTHFRARKPNLDA